LAEFAALPIEKFKASRLRAGTKPSTVNPDLDRIRVAMGKAVDGNGRPTSTPTTLRRWFCLRQIPDSAVAKCWGMTWEAVDIERRLVNAIAAAARAGRGRHVPLNAEALEVIQRLKLSSDGAGRVFRAASGAGMTHFGGGFDTQPVAADPKRRTSGFGSLARAAW